MRSRWLRHGHISLLVLGIPAVLFPYASRKMLNFGCNHFAYTPFPPGQGGPAGERAVYGALGVSLPLPPFPALGRFTFAN
eukprot:11225821-Lingulodinium_polyedra.AAC.1